MRYAGLLALMAGCTSMRPVPDDLQAARKALDGAVHAEGGDLAAVEIHAAKMALDRANALFESDPDSQDLHDLAYIAQRKSEYARVIAHIQTAVSAAKVADQDLSDARETATGHDRKMNTQLLAQIMRTENVSQRALDALVKLQNASIRQDVRGIIISLSSSVLFAPGQNELLDAARAQLDDIARALVTAQVQSIAIEGFADSTGSDRRNVAVAQSRADAVRRYLASKGVQLNKMQVVAHSGPSVGPSNGNPEGRAGNRRVDIVVRAQEAAHR